MAPGVSLRGQQHRTANCSAPHPHARPTRRFPAYRGQAGRYDRRTERFQHWRELLIGHLAVTRGDTVLDIGFDIGFGTGPCLPLLREKVGPTGTIIGVDASRQMLQIAAAERTHFMIILGIIL